MIPDTVTNIKTSIREFVETAADPSTLTISELSFSNRLVGLNLKVNLSFQITYLSRVPKTFIGSPTDAMARAGLELAFKEVTDLLAFEGIDAPSYHEVHDARTGKLIVHCVYQGVVRVHNAYLSTAPTDSFELCLDSLVLQRLCENGTIKGRYGSLSSAMVDLRKYPGLLSVEHHSRGSDHTTMTLVVKKVRTTSNRIDSARKWINFNSAPALEQLLRKEGFSAFVDGLTHLLTLLSTSAMELNRKKDSIHNAKVESILLGGRNHAGQWLKDNGFEMPESLSFTQRRALLLLSLTGDAPDSLNRHTLTICRN